MLTCFLSLSLSLFLFLSLSLSLSLRVFLSVFRSCMHAFNLSCVFAFIHSDIPHITPCMKVPAAYVEHAENWRELRLESSRNPSPLPSPQLTRRRASAHEPTDHDQHTQRQSHTSATQGGDEGVHPHLLRRGTPPEQAYEQWRMEHDGENANSKDDDVDGKKGSKTDFLSPPGHTRSRSRSAGAEEVRRERLRLFGRRKSGHSPPPERPDVAKVLHLQGSGPATQRELNRHKQKRMLIEEAQKKAAELVPSLRESHP